MGYSFFKTPFLKSKCSTFYLFFCLLHFTSFLKWMVDKDVILNFLSKPKANRVLTVLGLFSHCVSCVEELPRLLCSNSGLFYFV